MTPERSGELELSVVLVNHNGAGCLPGRARTRSPHGPRPRRRVHRRRLGLDRRQLAGRSTALGPRPARCASRRTSASAPAATAAPRRRRGRLLAFVNFDGAGRAGLGRAAARAARRRPRLGRDRPPAPRGRGDDRGGRARDRAEHGHLRPARRACRAAAAPAEPGRGRRRLGRADDGAPRRVPRARRLLRADLHVRRGGRLLPARAAGGSCLHPRARDPPRAGARRGPAALAAAALLARRATGSSTPRGTCRRRRS